MKKLRLLLLILLILTVSAGCSTQDSTMGSPHSEYIVITIFHTNDIHGRFVQSETSMGIDLVAAILADAENALLVDAGDTFHGLPFVNIGQGANAVELMNLAGYTLMAPGNHDFNFGTDRLIELAYLAEFDIITANVDVSGAPLFPATALREVAGVTLGFFGLANPNTPEATHPDNVMGVGFSDPVATARRAVDYLRAAGADVVIGVAHLGVDGHAHGMRVAREVQGIDVLIDGHSHTLLEAGEQVGDVLLVQAAEHLSHLGRIEIIVNNGDIISASATVINRDYAYANFMPHAGVAAAITAMQAEFNEAMNQEVGYMPITMWGDTGTSPEGIPNRDNLRSKAMPIGNLLADSMRWASGADLALINSGSIRYHFYEGSLTIEDVLEVLPFPNYIVVVEITPVQLREALENAVSLMPGDGRFVHISGFSFMFDQFAEDDERVLGIYVDGIPLDMSDSITTYTLAINDFLQAGGDGFIVFTELAQTREASLLSDELIRFLQYMDIDEIIATERIMNVAE